MLAISLYVGGLDFSVAGVSIRVYNLQALMFLISAYVLSVRGEC